MVDFGGCVTWGVSKCKGTYPISYSGQEPAKEKFNIGGITITSESRNPLTYVDGQGTTDENILKMQELKDRIAILMCISAHMLGKQTVFEKEIMKHLACVPQTKPTTENKIMNQVQQAVQILNTEYKIAEVIFKLGDPSDDQQHYNYKIPPNINVKIGDDLIVNVSNDPEAPRYKGVRCIKILPNEESIFIEGVFLKWIVDKVDITAYRFSKGREDALIESLEIAMRTKKANDKRKEVVKGLNKKILKKLGLWK